MIKTILFLTALAPSAFAFANFAESCPPLVEGKKLTCNVTYQQDHGSKVVQTVSEAFKMVNPDEPSLPNLGTCRAALTIVDTVSGLHATVNSDEFAQTTISILGKASLLAPEISGNIANDTLVAVAYSFRSNPLVDAQGKPVQAIKFSCGLQK